MVRLVSRVIGRTGRLVRTIIDRVIVGLVRNISSPIVRLVCGNSGHTEDF